MKYFAKYLPVEEEIKEGDDILYKNGDSLHYTTYRSPYYDRYDWVKRVKLFLCSRDIQVGDTVEKIDSLSKYWDLESENDVRIAKEQGFFKVIGEISPDAKWVREGDEFDESEIEKVADLSSTFHTNYEPWIEGREKQGYKMLILLKGPCGHFH